MPRFREVLKLYLHRLGPDLEVVRALHERVRPVLVRPAELLERVRPESGHEALLVVPERVSEQADGRNLKKSLFLDNNLEMQ